MNKALKTMKYLNFNVQGSHFEILETSIPVPQENQYLVRVFATCLNRLDLLEKRGKYQLVKDNKILGIELIGIPVDHETLKPLEKGLKIIGGIVKGGSYAQYTVIPKSHTFEFDFPVKSIDVSNNLSALNNQMEKFFGEEIAKEKLEKEWPALSGSLPSFIAIPEAFMTAYQLLKYYGNVQPNDIVYIPAGAGGIGSAAIQLAKRLFKARVISSCSSKAKADLCHQLGADLVLDYKSLSEAELLDSVMSFSSGKGVDCIIDPIGPSKASFHGKIIAEDGHWVLYGFLGGPKGPCENLMSDVLYKRVHFIGSLLRNREDKYKEKLVSDVMKEVLPLLKNGELKPVVGNCFFLNLGNPQEAKIMDEAHSLMETNESTGRIIVFLK